ncbi:unnamed protein product [Hyaloperonospora brassicae]|uniref:PHD-type domain-containing protein n=1 Tax=Hyaloperonospora brassicae TaxID=162125 RepID=A0AAV0UA72_HYABA|nr:unnamed protein product [Hyaloperonospora brassicae]
MTAPESPSQVPPRPPPLLRRHDAPPHVHSPPVAQFGAVATRADVRAQLRARYGRPAPFVTELTLRVDTELELLRRRCFAQRNAQWTNATPDQVALQPLPCGTWRRDAARAHDGEHRKRRKTDSKGLLETAAAAAVGGAVAAVGGAVLETPAESDTFVRERPWPPREFAGKPVAKPARGRGGKRKALPMGAVLEPVPRVAKVCRACRTQSTPLWRTVPLHEMDSDDAGADAVGTGAVALTPINGGQRGGQLTSGIAGDDGTQPQKGAESVALCLACYLKLERADLFAKKRTDRTRDERRKQEQAAAAALQEKRRLKQQTQSLKKQQQQQQLQEKKHKKQDGVGVQLVLDDETVDERVPEAGAASDAQSFAVAKEEVDVATEPWKDKKKDRKHSHKDKKKKKKHRRKVDELDDLESDGLTPVPSPAQMNGHVYADRSPEVYANPPVSALETDRASSKNRPADPVAAEAESEVPDDVLDDPKDEAVSAATARSSSRKRKSAQRTEPGVLAESPVSAPKKRSTSLSRASRLKQTPARATTPVPSVGAVSPAASVKKRLRTKKESAHERELRALGQYCPVCNEVYEDDDPNTFVCCDSCELWVHGACDPTLTQELIAAMANTDDKYVCPLCAGR